MNEVITLHEQGGVRVTAIDHWDGTACFFLAVDGRQVARVSSYHPGRLYGVKTRPGEQVAEAAIAQLREAAQAYAPTQAKGCNREAGGC